MIDSLLKKAIETRLASSGLTWARLEHFELKTAEKRMTATLSLAGESTPVSVMATYQVEALEVLVTSVATNRQWMTEALSMALLKHGGRIPIPPGLPGMMAKMLL
jgi:hypothetical protein